MCVQYLHSHYYRTEDDEEMAGWKNDGVRILQKTLDHSSPGFWCEDIENCRDVGNSLITRITVGELPQQSGDQAQSAHNGVICDGCSESNIERRFKCTVCPDYDLCLKC